MAEREGWDRCENCDWPIPEGRGHVRVINGVERFYCNPEMTTEPLPGKFAPPTRHVMTYEEGSIRR